MGANVTTSLFNKIEWMLKKMLTGPLNSLFRRSSQRSGDRKGKRHGKRAEATLNSPAEVKLGSYRFVLAPFVALFGFASIFLLTFYPKKHC